MDGYAYICSSEGKTRFKVEKRVEDSNVLKVLVKSTVRKDGSVIARLPAEYYDKEQEEWKKTACVTIESAASLRNHPPEKGKGLTLVRSLGFGCILCLHDPQPTWEDEDVDEQRRAAPETDC